MLRHAHKSILEACPRAGINPNLKFMQHFIKKLSSSYFGCNQNPVRSTLCYYNTIRLNHAESMNNSKLLDLYTATKKTSAALIPQSNINPETVFANNELDLSEIEVYGFDFDYTLVQYKESMLRLIYDLARDHLVQKCKYPKALNSLQYLPTFAVRGLHYDFKEGLLMKIDSFHQIQLGSVYRGLTPVKKEEVMELYKSETVPQCLITGEKCQMVQLSDLFSVPEILLLSQVTEYFEEHSIPYHPQILFQDVKYSVSSIHPIMHDIVTEEANIGNYLVQNPTVKKLLERLRNSGKKLFLITNSPFSFVNAGMCYLLGSTWQQLFDVIIVQARKPHFFQEKTRPFRIYDPLLKRHKWEKIYNLESNKIYMEGTVSQLHSMTGWEGSRVLYFGDHVYADLLDATLTEGWKTAAIISELQDEINTLNTDKCKQAVSWLQSLQLLIEEMQGQKDAEKFVRVLMKERDELRLTTKHLFNKQFGSMFRTFHNPTYFSRRLFRYSDVYTSSVTNLLNYSTKHIFYPRRGALPHESKFSIFQ